MRNSLHAETVELNAALARVRANPVLPDLLMLSLGDGYAALGTLQRLRQLHPDLKIVLLCQSGRHRQVIAAVRMLGQDYLMFPFRDSELLDLVHKHVGTIRTPDTTEMATVEEVGGEHFFLSASALMNKVRLQAELLANMEAPVLITGESGSGKEVIAQLIHKLSPRSDRPFLKIRCAALAGDLLERELFGWERRASTDTPSTKAGKFELCNKGTILLDEITEMPANLQAKLLHVLQEKQFFRWGGETVVEVDVRVLATSSVDIQEAIAKRGFRKDLYYRLNGFSVALPPLRERREEIPNLLRHFMHRIAAQCSRAALPFSPRLMDACVQYSWPGNLRELQNFVIRYLVMADESMAIGELIEGERKLSLIHRVTELGVPSASSEPKATEARGPDLKCLLRSLKHEAEVQLITDMLAETDWNRRKAARLLHISYRGLLYKIRQHAITRAPASPPSMAADLIHRQTFARAAAAVTNQISSPNRDAHNSKPSR
jgi:DNA-binding NtrC family response regulator